MNIPTFTYGKVPVQAWEYPAIIFIVILFSIIGLQIVRKKNYKSQDPSWKYFLPGMWLKLGGGLFFALIYVLYYKGGDTTSYYECSLAFINLLYHNPMAFFEAMLGGGTLEIKSLFTSQTGSPMGYVFLMIKHAWW